MYALIEFRHRGNCLSGQFYGQRYHRIINTNVYFCINWTNTSIYVCVHRIRHLGNCLSGQFYGQRYHRIISNDVYIRTRCACFGNQFYGHAMLSGHGGHQDTHNGQTSQWSSQIEHDWKLPAGICPLFYCFNHLKYLCVIHPRCL